MHYWKLIRDFLRKSVSRNMDQNWTWNKMDCESRNPGLVEDFEHWILRLNAFPIYLLGFYKLKKPRFRVSNNWNITLTLHINIIIYSYLWRLFFNFQAISRSLWLIQAWEPGKSIPGCILRRVITFPFRKMITFQ